MHPARLSLGLITFVCIFGVISGLERGERCTGRNNAFGTCKLIYECAQTIKDIKAGLGRVLCKTGEQIEVVCCVEANSQVTVTSLSAATPAVDVSTLRLADRKCHEYSEYVYQNESYPVLLPGAKPIIKRVDKCGHKVVPLIVGGTAAAPKEFPHMALLGYGNLNNIRWGCGGAIISRRFILTAGHCVVTRDGAPTYVRIGDLVWDKDTDDADPKTIRVARSIANPNYQAPIQYHDIALLELGEDMVFNAYARPACLNSNFNVGKNRAIASGWGSTEWFGDSSSSLLKVTLDFFRFSECQPQYEANRKLNRGLQEDQQLCAGSYDKERDTCEGDSGGPLQIYHDIYCMYKIVGVTSFGKGCGTAGLPGIYARVSNYIDWIERTAFVYG